MDLKRFDTYKQAVILEYQKKKNEGSLPRNLQNHTPANLKKECVDEFPTKYSNKDNETFKSFFGRANNAEEYFQKVRNSDPDIFKPLNNFLRKDADSGTFDRNIELLAWLIDFKSRPFKPGNPYDLGKPEPTSLPTIQEPVTRDSNIHVEESKPEELSVTHEILVNDIKEAIPQGSPSTKMVITLFSRNIVGIPIKFRKIIKVLLFAIIILTSSYIFYDKTKQQYMYWDGRQYQLIKYDQKVDGAVIIPLDTFKLAHLKKIENISLITRNSIGKVYYSKVNGKVEFYTSKGDYPEDSNRTLRPMSKYIYIKYILKKSPSN